MYAIILEKFDFDDNKTISKTEFYDGFLLMAWVDSNIDEEFQKQELATASGSPNLGNLFHDWVLNFNNALVTQIKKLGHQLDQPNESLGVNVPQQGTVAASGQAQDQTLNIISRMLSSMPETAHPMELERNYRKRPKGLF